MILPNFPSIGARWEIRHGARGSRCPATCSACLSGLPSGKPATAAFSASRTAPACSRTRRGTPDRQDGSGRVSRFEGRRRGWGLHMAGLNTPRQSVLDIMGYRITSAVLSPAPRPRLPGSAAAAPRRAWPQSEPPWTPAREAGHRRPSGACRRLEAAARRLPARPRPARRRAALAPPFGPPSVGRSDAVAITRAARAFETAGV